jgi:hypothetical protein
MVSAFRFARSRPSVLWLTLAAVTAVALAAAVVAGADGVRSAPRSAPDVTAAALPSAAPQPTTVPVTTAAPRSTTAPAPTNGPAPTIAPNPPTTGGQSGTSGPAMVDPADPYRVTDDVAPGTTLPKKGTIRN